MRTRKPKKLSAEEKALWAKVARSTRPLSPKSAEQEKTEGGEVARPSRPHPPKPQVQDFRIGERAVPPALQTHISPTVSETLNQAPVRMDHALYKQMRRGKLKPDARIDLHGLTLAEAHPRLIGFIQTAYAEQKRLVLVITGKGKDRDDPGPIPIRRGVLRHQVPGWLMSPPLGGMVMDIRPAHLRHGGEGAYYVYLKRPR